MKFSITIPAYKSQFLHECIESVLMQTYEDFELVIVDDNSPYHLEKIVGGFNDSRIRYYRNEKGFGGLHVVGNWNKCLEYAQGEYIICMGDDDRLLPNCLIDYAELINKYPGLDIYHARTEMIDENRQVIDMQIPFPEYESVYSMIWNTWKGRDQYIGDFLFRTDALRTAGGFYDLPYAWSSDKISEFRAAIAKGIANTQRPGFQYRKSTQTITNSNNTQRERYEALVKEKKWYRDFIADSHPVDEMDKKYLDLIKSHLDSYMAKRMHIMRNWDLTVSPSHFLYWVKKRKEYQLNESDIFNAFQVSTHEITARIIRPFLNIVRR